MGKIIPTLIATSKVAFHTLTGLSGMKRSSYTSLTLRSLLYVTAQSKHKYTGDFQTQTQVQERLFKL